MTHSFNKGTNFTVKFKQDTRRHVEFLAHTVRWVGDKVEVGFYEETDLRVLRFIQSHETFDFDVITYDVAGIGMFVRQFRNYEAGEVVEADLSWSSEKICSFTIEFRKAD
jgi:hypothetical protein